MSDFTLQVICKGTTYSLRIAETIFLLRFRHANAETMIERSIFPFVLRFQPVIYIQLAFVSVELLSFLLSRQDEIWQPSQNRIEVDESCGASLIDLSKLAESVEQLLDFCILVSGSTPAKYLQVTR